ncbi:Retrovirus-related Pol polyprotein from transposon TNT 1-94 [Orchesella cincta]|uniref:Retrovirus-related Pol polyprotein from transposon TNT 1-94 n=1 Tax=Orchesella cincta TaxID=48709 RepID=A0A1D2MW00_ORCCI|nr:Retrovirus-related Pol polyprotein from transposon TNT 1-94 [Orchesella cincta]
MVHLGHIKTFGCTAYKHVPKQQRGTWDAKSTKCILVGYDSNSNNYRLYDSERGNITIGRNVTFEEEAVEYVPVRVHSDCNSEEEDEDSGIGSTHVDEASDSETNNSMDTSEDNVAAESMDHSTSTSSSTTEKLITVKISANNKTYEAQIPENGEAPQK